MSKLRIGALVAAILALSACSARLTPPAYQSSRDTLFYLHQTHARPVGVSTFSGRRLSSLWLQQCRPINTARSRLAVGDYSYIRNALISELSTARLYSASGGAVTLAGNVERIRFNRTGPFEARWRIRLRLSSSNGRALVVQEDYKFDADGFIGPAACGSAGRALEPAVRSLIEKAVTHPNFRALLA